MLYTRKGDGGTTKTFGCDQRVSKSSNIAEALGTLDEINSYLGVCRTRSVGMVFDAGIGKIDYPKIIFNIQQNLFIVQAELAGSDMSMTPEKVKEVEFFIDGIEKELPPIKSFFISGSDEISAMFDFARTLSRRAERRVVGVSEEGKVKVGKDTLAYMNRLSSILYAFARYASFKAGVVEERPHY